MSTECLVVCSYQAGAAEISEMAALLHLLYLLLLLLPLQGGGGLTGDPGEGPALVSALAGAG